VVAQGRPVGHSFGLGQLYHQVRHVEVGVATVESRDLHKFEVIPQPVREPRAGDGLVCGPELRRLDAVE